MPRFDPGTLAQRVKEVHAALHAWDMHILKDPQHQLRGGTQQGYGGTFIRWRNCKATGVASPD